MCGLPLFPPKPKHENPARARRTLRRIATWERGAKKIQPHSPASSQYTPAERAGLFLKAEGKPQ